MKKLLLSAALIAVSFTTFAQVGVGTTTPSGALDVVGLGTTNATKALEINNSANTELVTVLDNGLVGINQTNPTSTLDIEQTTPNAINIARSNNALTEGILQIGITHTSIESIGKIKFNNSLTGDISLYLANKGLGIGQSHPKSALDVVGYIKLSSIDNRADAASITNAQRTGMIRYNGALQFHDGTTWNTVDASDDAWVNNASNVNLNTGNAIVTTGNIGIGNATPASKLDIATNSGSLASFAKTNGALQSIAILAGSSSDKSSGVIIGNYSDDAGTKTLRTYMRFYDDGFIFEDASQFDVLSVRTDTKSVVIGYPDAIPKARLDVSGYIRVTGSDAIGDTVLAAGMIRYSSGTQKFEGYNGTAWVPFN